MRKEIFEKTLEMDFEGEKIQGLELYDEYLKKSIWGLYDITTSRKKSFSS